MSFLKKKKTELNSGLSLKNEEGTDDCDCGSNSFAKAISTDQTCNAKYAL